MSGSKHRQISQVVNSNDPQRSAKQSRAEICNHMLAPADQAATLHKPACLGLNRWPASVVSRLSLPKLQFSQIKLVKVNEIIIYNLLSPGFVS